MNKDRRKALNALQDRLEALKSQLVDYSDLVTELEEIKEELITLKDEEQDAYDNMPDGLKEGERGTAAQEAVSQMDTADGELETLIEALGEDHEAKIDEIFGYIEDAKGMA